MGGRLIEKSSSAYDFPLLVRRIIDTPLRAADGQRIVHAGHGRHTYADLRERIGRLASALQTIGVRPGDTVGVMDWDSHRFLEAYLAVPMMEAILFTVNVRLSPEQIIYTANHSGASVMLVHEDFLDLLEQVRPKLTALRAVVILSDKGTSTSAPWAVGEYEAIVGAASPDFRFQDFDENTQATTFYTTGTTGNPKGVYFSHRQLVLHTVALLARFGSQASQGRFHLDDVYMPMTPMFHVHAWGFPWAATMAGVKQVYPGRYVPDVLLDLIRSEGVTFTHCVPTVLQMILNAPASKGVDLSRLKMVIGGSALPAALARQALERGIDIFAGYGMSETGPIMTVARPSTDHDGHSLDAQIEQRARAGYAGPLVEVRVVDSTMADVPRDSSTAGEVVARAPWLTQGYWQNPDASEELWSGGYLHTNDVATVAPDGCIQITDRLKDVIKTGGEWVSSLQIESLISQSADVVEAAVIGVKDDRWGERPLAIVAQRDGQDSVATEAVIKRDLAAFANRGVISKYAIPERIVFVDALPKTSVGKLDKKALRALYG